MATNPDPRGGAFIGPYTDPALTIAPPPWGPTGRSTPTPAANAPGAATAERADEPGTRPQVIGDTHKATPVYDTPDVNHEPGDQGAVVPPNSPNSWAIEDVVVNEGTDIETTQPFGRDPYRNGGMVGQTFLRNQGE